MTTYRDNDVLLYIFGKQGPLVWHIPHVVVSCTAVAIDIVLNNAVRQQAGVWGLIPPFDVDMSPDPRDLDTIEAFRLWSLPQNQAELHRAVEKPYSEKFSCVMPQSVDDDTLHQLQATAAQSGAVFLDDTWPSLLRLLPRISWFFAPLGEFVPLAIYCTTDSPQVDGVITALREAGEPMCQVAWTSSGESWNLGNELRARCGLNSEVLGEEPRDENNQQRVPFSAGDEAMVCQLQGLADSVEFVANEWRLTVTNNTALLKSCEFLRSDARSLRITACLDVTDDGLKSMPVMANLVSIRLCTAVTAAGIRQLDRHPKLRALTIFDVKLANDDLETLAAFRSFSALQCLEIDNGDLSSTGIERIVSQSHIRSIILDGTTVKSS